MTTVLKCEPGAGRTRQRVLDNARRLFAARGFHAVSLRELAQAVGLQAGSLYIHIESKDALLQELIEDGFVGLIDSMQGLLAGTDAERGLSVFLRHHLAFQRANPHWHLLASIEARHLGAEGQQELRELKADYAYLLERLLVARFDGHGDALRITRLARQTLHLIDCPPSDDDTPLDDCLDDIEQLILNRLHPSAFSVSAACQER